MAGAGQGHVEETGVFLTLLDGELGGHRILAVAREDRRRAVLAAQDHALTRIARRIAEGLGQDDRVVFEAFRLMDGAD